MTNLNLASIWQRVDQNQNTWVLFRYGTVVIFLPNEIVGIDLRAEAIKRLKSLVIKNVVVAELVGQGLGWIINCGDDYILNYLPFTDPGKYGSRYDRMIEIIEIQKRDQRELEIVHIQKTR
jgi:hypothetical protein